MFPSELLPMSALTFPSQTTLAVSGGLAEDCGIDGGGGGPLHGGGKGGAEVVEVHNW